jgi:hypothetical protein
MTIDRYRGLKHISEVSHVVVVAPHADVVVVSVVVIVVIVVRVDVVVNVSVYD